MRIHIELEPAVVADPTQKAAKRTEIDDATNITNVNETRFTNFGILSGDITSMSDITGLKGMVGIKSVTIGDEDETQG